MKRRIVLLISITLICISTYGQGNVSEFKLPPKIERTINRICCDCKIYDVWTPLDNSFYYYKYMDNGEEFNVTLDSSGYWTRTYQQVNIDSIPQKCKEIFDQQKNKYEQEYKIEEYISPNKKKIEAKKYELERVLKELNDQNTIGYYEFVLQKPISKEFIFGDTVLNMDTRSIKINFDCELLNSDLKEVIRVDGQPLLEYTYFINDSSTYNSSTTTIEYSNGKKNGLYIQYFKYPNHIASVDYYINNNPKGPFYSYHRNGKIKEIGVNENGVRKTIDKWFIDGTQYLKYVDIDTIGHLFTDNNQQHLNGRYVIEGQEVFFTQGKVDSTISDQGKYTRYHQNFIDSTRTLFYYNEAGFIRNKRIIKITTYSITISNYNGFAVLNDNSKFSNGSYDVTYYEKSNVVKQEGAYSNSKKTGKWYYYNMEGQIINEENYSD